jgi:2-polyprenyl-3-methyl-5-hydroxy-6-metoxy-1,4-benzoquinol methylase
VKQATKAVWGTNPAGWTHAKDKIIGTREFFEQVVHERFTKEVSFLPELVQYQNWAGKKVLEIGCGAGYDAYMFCKNGAEYTGVDLAPENIERTRKHLDLYNYQATLLEADAEHLDLMLNSSEQFDLIYSFGVLHHIPNIEQVLKNLHARLKPDGKIFIAVYNKNSLFYWLYLYCFRWLYLGERKKYSSFQERVARIEYTDSEELPYVKVYTEKIFRETIKNANFNILNVWRRKLEKEDLPPFRFIWKIYKYIPQSFLDFLAKRWGWYLCLTAQKQKI